MAKPQEVFRLTEIEPEFVSLVHAGANRQTSFLVVKTAGGEPESKTPTDPQHTDPAPEPGAPPQVASPGGAEKGSATDSLDLSWLGPAQARVDALLVDALLERALTPPCQSVAMAASTPAPMSVETAKAADPPAPLPDPALVAEVAKSKEQVAAANAETDRLRSELAKAQREALADRARMVALKGAVGGTAVLASGRVTKQDSAPESGQAPTGIWSGDLAAEAKRSK